MERFVKIKVNAGAKDERIELVKKDEYVISTPAQRKNGDANRSVMRILSKHLKISQGKLHMVKGHTSTSKIIKIFE